MKFLIRVALWGSLASIAAWWVRAPWERFAAAAAAGLAAPSGTRIEVVDLEVFYPFDLAVFVALCLASAWTPWARRWRAIAMGTPFLVVVEIAALAAAMRLLMSSGAGAAGDRLANAILRSAGWFAACIAWLLLLGRERLSLAARRWLGG